MSVLTPQCAPILYSVGLPRRREEEEEEKKRKKKIEYGLVGKRKRINMSRKWTREGISGE